MNQLPARLHAPASSFAFDPGQFRPPLPPYRSRRRTSRIEHRRTLRRLPLRPRKYTPFLPRNARYVATHRAGATLAFLVA